MLTATIEGTSVDNRSHQTESVVVRHVRSVPKTTMVPEVETVRKGESLSVDNLRLRVKWLERVVFNLLFFFERKEQEGLVLDLGLELLLRENPDESAKLKIQLDDSTGS